MRQLSRRAAVGLELLVLPQRSEGNQSSRLNCRIPPERSEGGTLNSADPANELAGNAADVHRVRCSVLLCDFFIFFITEKTKIEIMSFVFC